MKKLMSIFWEEGVMKAYPQIDFNEHTFAKYGDHAPAVLYDAKNEARLAALPIAEESKERVKELMWYAYVNSFSQPIQTWQPDITKEYQIEAEMREGYNHTEECRIECICTVDDKVLVLVD